MLYKTFSYSIPPYGVDLHVDTKATVPLQTYAEWGYIKEYECTRHAEFNPVKTIEMFITVFLLLIKQLKTNIFGQFYISPTLV